MRIIDMDNAKFMFIELGTLAWYKDEDGQVYQCRCVGHKLSNATILTSLWQIAGKDAKKQYTIKHVYNTERGAFFHLSNDELHYNEEMDFVRRIHEKYPKIPFSSKYFVYDSPCCSNDFYAIHLYNINDDGTIRFWRTEIELCQDENGCLDVRLPLYEEGKAFLTFEEAESHVKRPKAITFDDVEKKTPTKTKVTLTIEVECDKVEDIKAKYQVLKMV